ncbi:hypothetical protein GQ43DRAFT_470527 [Delitschia confertaspora ATCC 74209]|uniref:DUF4484 domain-containing protein n=1 Tax=Delitschia confertaspora ATCC 74209 TaxID=1513339 RepID=A0A9P4JR34_9PLEO|nr:hypothetical protein GQ43DRAFT_470527 [Delitschia confertaspora ATCC 74209]
MTSGESSSNDVESNVTDSEYKPSISALFLIKFDQKVGYVLSWKRSANDVTLEGAVEYKSLPSGLHAVKSDLVYFIHEGYAGLSAFVNGPASEAERNAHFVAVGVLVPLSYGRLGRSWLHARSLQKMASTLANDPSDMTPLEEFWEQYRADAKANGHASKAPGQPQLSESAPQARPGKHSRARALSSITAVLPAEQLLPTFHPALSVLQYIDTFGPLVFRLQEAALLRKRVLFMTTPPVRAACEYVYNLSLLSSIPNPAFNLLPPGAENLHRLRSLFTIGIHDIPELEKMNKPANGNSSPSESPVPPEGWVACTTDEIITTKSQLYDIIVEMPPVYDAKPQKRRWPTIKTSDGAPVKATQRDLWRYKLLRHELRKYRDDFAAVDSQEEEEDTAQLLPHDENKDDDEHSIDELYDEKLVEPMTWSRLAYYGFMWWASAGEKDAFIKQEQDRDRALLGDLSDFLSDEVQNEQSEERVHAGLHTAIIAYFHRWTSSMINTLSELIEASDDNEDDDQEAVHVSKDDISALGFDCWSEPDKAFIGDFAWMYFGRRVEVYGGSIECCGLQIC